MAKHPLSLLTSQLTLENRTVTVGHEFDLGGETIDVPRGVTLRFTNGGYLANGTLRGHGSYIDATRRVFDNIKVEGSWTCTGNVLWWADGCDFVEYKPNTLHIPTPKDETDALQLALDSSFRELHFPPRPYYVARTLVLRREKRLVLHGSRLAQSLNQMQPMVENTCVIFSNRDITLLKIDVNEGRGQWSQSSVCIEGGTFDVSLCDGYSSSCILLSTDGEARMWGVRISTAVRGSRTKVSSVGISLNPVADPSAKGNKAYATDVRLDCEVSGFTTGIVALNHTAADGYTPYNWLTSLTIDGCIRDCETAIISNVEGLDVRAMLQAAPCFSTKENGAALVVYDGTSMGISSDFYDLTLSAIAPGGSTCYQHQYALRATVPNSFVATYGVFAAKVALARLNGNEPLNTELGVRVI